MPPRLPTVIASLVLATPLAGQMPTVDAVLDRASAYVATYEQSLGMLIAEERYDQKVPAALAGFSGGRPSASSSFPGLSSRAAPEHVDRRLKSDFLMMRLPNDGNQWVGLRVTVEVDGQEVRDRGERVQALLTEPTDSTIEQWRRMAEESARFNLGDVMRTTNVPTFALIILHPEHRSRFAFELADTDRVEGQDVWVLRFRESQGPTLISDPVRRIDVPTHGRLWINPENGRVVRTELRTGNERDGELRSEIVVRYRPDEDLDVWVPRDMKEKYEDRYGLLFEGDARYSNFQRFGVSTEADLADQPAGPEPTAPVGGR